MEDKLLLVGLLFTSTLNMLFLLVICMFLLRFISSMTRLAKRAESLIAGGEQEIRSIGTSLRHTVTAAGQILGIGAGLAEKYLVLLAMKQAAKGGKWWQKILAGLGAGYSLAIC